MRWKEIEISKAKELLVQGCNFFEIADELGRSRDSVKNKLNRLGLRYEDFNEFREERECLECQSSFETTKSDPKKFCNHSCSATYNNKLKDKYFGSKCKRCGIEFSKKQKTKKRKFCSRECSNRYRVEKNFLLIESGDSTVSSDICKKYLVEKHGEKCMKCCWNEKNSFSGNIPIELEHKDGNSENNRLDNLELLCPNCHSLTPTYRALNIGNGRHERRKRYSEGKSY